MSAHFFNMWSQMFSVWSFSNMTQSHPHSSVMHGLGEKLWT